MFCAIIHVEGLQVTANLSLMLMSKGDIMERQMKQSLSPLVIALACGVLVAFVSMAIFVGAAWASPVTQEAGEETVGYQECAACHPNVNAAWENSTHAHAFDNQNFQENWQAVGNAGDCLLCHTTGYKATTGQYSAEGITCEACHGEVVVGHPPAVVPVRADTEYCGQCHPITLGEWRLSGHAFENVGCTNCHNPHSQEPRFENPDEMCINCHKDSIGDHKDDVHIGIGIGCVDCHALVHDPEIPPIDGLKPTGHTFTITPQTCVACHTDTLQVGRPLPGYERGAKEVALTLPEEPQLPVLIAEYTVPGSGGAGLAPEQQIQALQAALASTRLTTLFQGGIVGLVLGGMTAYLVAMNARRNNGETLEKSSEEETEESDTEQEDA
jgi:hypothetical protein